MAVIDKIIDFFTNQFVLAAISSIATLIIKSKYEEKKIIRVEESKMRKNGVLKLKHHSLFNAIDQQIISVAQVS